MKHILILSANAGFGHLSAAKAVGAALQETHGHDCTFEIINPLEDSRVPSFLRNSQSDYDRVVRDMPGLYRFGYKASDAPLPSAIIDRALTVILFETMRDLLRREQPDALVTTYPLYQAPIGAVNALSRHSTPLVTVVTDLATVHRVWFNDACDLCLVPTQKVQDLAVESGLAAEKVKISGLPVHPRFFRDQRSRTELIAELGWEKDRKTVLAVGSRRVEGLLESLQALNHSGLPLQLAVVAGGDAELYTQLQETDWHLPTCLYNFVEDMPALMHAADLILCKAVGLIVAEALACGLPLLLINVIPGQETGNAEVVVTGGAGELAHNPLEVLKIAFHWLDRNDDLLARRSANARRLGRPRAAYEAAQFAWSAAQVGFKVRVHPRLPTRTALRELLDRFSVPWKEDRREHRAEEVGGGGEP